MRSASFLACTSLLAMAVCVVIGPELASSAESEWEQIRTNSKPRRIGLPGDSYIEIAAHSNANVSFNKGNPSIHLSVGRLTANLLASSRTFARLSASQVFVRASDGLFFISNETRGNRTTIGVCRGVVTAFAGKGAAASSQNALASGEFTIEAGEQAIISGDGTIMKEQDPSMDCDDP